MTPFVLLLIHLAMSFAAASLFAKQVALPRLATRSREEALAPLLWVHVAQVLMGAVLLRKRHAAAPGAA